MGVVLKGEKAGTVVPTVGHGRHLTGLPHHVGTMVQLKAAVRPEEPPA